MKTNSTFDAAYSTLTNWAAFSPIDSAGAATSADLLSLDFNDTEPFIPHTFTDVTGLGFYVEHETTEQPIHVHIEGFGATLVPDPSTPLLLLGALGGFLSIRRRTTRGDSSCLGLAPAHAGSASTALAVDFPALPPRKWFR